MNAPPARKAADLLLSEQNGWSQIASGATVFWFKGYEQSRDAAVLAAEAAKLPQDRQACEAWLRGLDGFFALVVERSGWVMAAADRVGSMPLIWSNRNGRVIVTQNGPALEKALALGPVDVNSVAALSIAMSGYTIGSDTLYQGVQRLNPGQYLWITDQAAEVGTYHQWQPWKPSDAAPEDLAEPLSALHEQLIEKLMASAGGRPILVPLSAGLDSRMILSGLIAAGYPHVRAFTYGQSGNREATVSKHIATRLGVDWTFVPYSRRAQRQTMLSGRHRAYEDYADNLTGVHFPQDYLALTTMIEAHGSGPDTIVVNGQTGDFITGNHVLRPLTQPDLGADAAERWRRILDVTLLKHFKMWRALEIPQFQDRIRERLLQDMNAAGGLPGSALADHGVYEFSEFVNRQSKYVIHGQRGYEYLGLDWRLPLWDRENLDFWARAPLAAKRGQNLYRTVLENENWGGVWRDIPVNPRRIRPAWVVPIRFALKLGHAPLGRAKWHRFEKRYLDYWMSPLCSFAPWPYRRVARDRRGHVNALAWYCETYLNRKGLAWDGERHLT